MRSWNLTSLVYTYGTRAVWYISKSIIFYLLFSIIVCCPIQYQNMVRLAMFLSGMFSVWFSRCTVFYSNLIIAFSVFIRWAIQCLNIRVLFRIRIWITTGYWLWKRLLNIPVVRDMNYSSAANEIFDLSMIDAVLVHISRLWCLQ